MLNRSIIPSPLGDLVAIADDTHLLRLDFADAEDLERQVSLLSSHLKSPVREGGDNLIIKKTKQELAGYFAGKRKIFSVPYRFIFGTDFQRKTWNALTTIPYGQTYSYQQEATVVGNPKAVRAIGGANHANPISIIVPCHRVIGKSGKLTGYGGGLDRKASLLDLEKQFSLAS